MKPAPQAERDKLTADLASSGPALRAAAVPNGRTRGTQAGLIRATRLQDF
jgi:hypothetical protein